MKPKFIPARFRNQTMGATLVSALFVSFSGIAGATTWVGDTSNAWNDNLNWSGDAGTGGSNAIININTTTPPFPVISADIVATPVDIFVGNAASTSGRVDHTAGTAGTGNGNWMFVGTSNATATGVYNLADTAGSGGTLTGFGTGSGNLNVGGPSATSGRLYIGGRENSNGGTGTFNVNTTGTVKIGNDLVVGSSGGTGVVNLDAGTITTNGWNFFGTRNNQDGGNGTLKMSGGTLTNGTTNGSGCRTYIGLGNSTGSVQMTGGTYNNNKSGNDTQFIVGTGNLSNGTTPTLTMTGGTINSGRLFTIGGTEAFGGNTGNVGPGKGSATINGSGAVLNSTGEFWVGQGTASVGDLTFNAGAINCGSWVAVGRGGGSGTVTMTGGTWTKTGSGTSYIIGASGPGVMTQSGGLVDVQAGDTWMAESNVCTYTLSGTGEFRAGYFQVARNGGSTGNVNLNGGTLRVNQIVGGGGVENVSFNGTQIVAKVNQTNFIGGMDAGGATIDAGGLLVDSNGFTLTAPQAIDGSGGVVKSGAGSLTLSGLNSYTGNNTVNAGALILSSSSSGTGNITVADGATAGVTASIAVGAQLKPTDVTFGTTAAGTGLSLNVGNVTGTNPSTSILDVTGNLSLAGNVTVNVSGSQFQAANLPLVSYNAANRTGSGVFNLGALPNGVVATIVDDPNFYGANLGLVYLNITSVALPKWDGTDAAKYAKTADLTTGLFDITVNNTTNVAIGQKVFGTGIPAGATVANISGLVVTLDQAVTANTVGSSVVFTSGTGTNDGVWDINTTQNWVDQVTSGNSVYKNPNPVLFDDSATGPTAISLGTTVNPSDVVFNNSTLAYSLSGAGAIDGGIGLTKQGTGSLTLGTINSYDGVTRLEGGVTSISTIEDGGTASPIGDSSAAPANLVLAGGVLEYTGAADSTNRGFTLTAAGSGLRSANDLAFSGQIASTGGNFRKQGAGNLSLTYGGINTLGNGGQVVYVEAGTLTFDGTAGGQVNNVLGEMWVGSVLDVPANLTVTNTTLNLNSWLAVGPGNGNDGVTNINITNSTVQTGGFSTGYNNGQANNASESFVTVSGSTWTNTGQIHIAESLNSTATVNVINTPWTSDSNNADMSTGAGTTSNLNISGTSEMKVNRFLMALGSGSVANVVIEDSGKLNKTGGSWMSIGNSNNGIATITVRDSGSLTNAGGDFNIGDVDTSNGTLILEDSATATSGGPVFIGKNGTTGAVNMSGASVMTVNNNTNVGGNTSSNGTLNVGGTASFTSTGRIQVGPNAGSTGTLIVQGSGVCGTSTYISIGYNGGGSMTVKDNGIFNGGNDFSVNESGDVPTSLTLQDNGTVNVTGSTFVGRNTGRVGTVTQTGGTFNANGNEFQVGTSGTGTWNQSGGVTIAAGWPAIGRQAGGVGALTVSGTGSFSQTATDRALIVGEVGTGTLTIQGTATVTSAGSNGVLVSNNAAGVGTVNLDGGTLQARKIADGGGNSTFHFNGGLLKAGAGADLNFMGGLDVVDIKPGGAFIDSNGQTIAIAQSIGDQGGNLTKQGVGTLLLNGASSYFGTTTVSVGALGGTGSVAGELVVSSGATIAPGASAGTFTVEDTLGSGSTIDGTYACEVDGATADKLAILGGLTVGAGAVLDFSTLSAPTAASYEIATFTSITGTFVEQNVPAGYEVVYNATSITLEQTATPYSTWASSFGLDPLTDGAPGVDKDGDGQSNIVEFALGGDPTSGSNNAKIYNLVADSDADGDSTNELVLTIAVRTGTPAFAGSPSPTATMDGATYLIQGSTDLGSFTTTVNIASPVTTGLPAAPTGYEYRSFSLNGSNGLPDKGFLRVRINN